MAEPTQAINHLKTAQNILILVGSGSNLDTIASALALKEFLTRQEKQVKVFSATPILPKLGFLPSVSEVEPGSNLTKNLVVEVSLKKAQLAELSYQKQDDKLSILLTPKSGEFAADDVNVKASAYPFDVIITLGISNLDELGLLYANHAQMFFNIPVINIDYKASNESFGQINLVNLTSSAISEVVFDLLSEYDTSFIDEKIATLLLTGLIYQTNSFRSQKTSPNIFLKASKLVSLGGKQQEIITQLYRSKSLGLLRLWGRVLARLKHEPDDQLVYSAVSAQDIERSEATIDDLDEIISEMTQQLGFAKNFVFFAEVNNQTHVYLSGSGSVNLGNLFTQYNPNSLTGYAIKFSLPKNVNDTETEIISIIRQELARSRA